MSYLHKYAPGTRTSDVPRRRLADVLRGLLGVTWLLASALDALITACLGIRPVGPQLAELRQAIADRYRLARENAVDAEVVDKEDT